MIFKNHYSQGVEEVSHRGKSLATSFNSLSFESLLESFKAMPFEVGFIPAGYQHRPDMISDLFYNTPTFDWLIMMFNNIKDPFQELNVNDRILIPKV